MNNFNQLTFEATWTCSTITPVGFPSQRTQVAWPKGRPALPTAKTIGNDSNSRYWNSCLSLWVGSLRGLSCLPARWTSSHCSQSRPSCSLPANICWYLYRLLICLIIHELTNLLLFPLWSTVPCAVCPLVNSQPILHLRANQAIAHVWADWDCQRLGIIFKLATDSAWG